MAKGLIITEKPSVARDITAALGGFTAKNGNAYWESAAFVCSYAVGHIFTLLEPEDIDSAFKQWKLSTLPILPKTFRLKPTPGHEARIKVLSQLISRSDVTYLVNACDAAREGELIFREIVSYLECRKWVRRLWLQSMTPEAIRGGFDRLKDGTDFDGLGAAAECRARSDWLIGMNATRAFSERLRNRGEKTPWSVGRVQTPTLALLVGRELQILSHEPKPFSRVVATFKTATHSYEGTWFDPAFKANELHPEQKDDRIFSPETAAKIVAGLSGAAAVAKEKREDSLRHAPYLFSLTGLQKYMAQRYKWSAKRTLEAAQRCYETHKVLTYPRTSSQCLPEDYRAEVERLIVNLAEQPAYSAAAGYLVEHGRRNDKRTFNNAGVSDHFAIIPTGKQRALSGDDGRLYDAVVSRFLATFHPPAVYAKVKRITVAAGHSFRTGPLETLMVPGWMSVYERTAADQKAALPPLIAGQLEASGVPVESLGGIAKAEVTKPPPRINEAGLLGLMEHAGRQIEDTELQAALTTAEGLGTAATRADIIQNLKYKEYVDEALRPTFKGIHLIRTLGRLQVSRLTSPELTAKLELALAEVEAGKTASAGYMSEVTRYTTEVVEAARRLDWAQVYPDREGLGPCPLCHSSPRPGPLVFERRLFYACASVSANRDSGCGFKLWKEVSGRYLTRPTVEQLLRDGTTHLLDGFKTKAGRDFKGVLSLHGGRLRLTDEDGLGEELAPPADPTSPAAPRSARQGAQSQDQPPAPRPSLGPCPVHGEGCNVLMTRGAFVCEHRLKAFAAGDTNPVGVMIPRLLCKRELSPQEVLSLLATGTTKELKGFVSKTGNAFAAKLVLSKEGGITFAFAERKSLTTADDSKGRSHKYPRRRASPRRSALTE